jgi:DNA-binding transcriptional LysR family regulator
LHLSQPALSRRIALLEHELGVAVFERDRRGARLTDAGSLFLPHAQAALASLRDGVAAVEALARGEKGSLTLAIVGTLASTDLTTKLRRFRDDHPQLQVHLRTGNSAEVSGLVHRGEAALGLRYFPDPSADVVSRVLYHEELVVVAAAEHALESARRIPPARLRDEPWVAFPSRRGSAVEPFGQVVARALAGAGLDGSRLVVVDSLTAQKRLVEAGFGLALIPESSVREELRLETLRRLDVPALRATVDVTVIHRKGAVLGPPALRLVDVLCSSAKDQPSRAGREARSGKRARTRRATSSKAPVASGASARERKPT